MKHTAQLNTAEINDRIGHLLNVNTRDLLFDKDPSRNVYMVSFNPIQNTEDLFSIPNQVRPPRKYATIRGVIVALGATPKDDKVIAHDYHYASPAVMDELIAFGDSIHVTTIFNEQMSLNLDTSVIEPAYEGTIVRIFKYNGEVFFSTYNRLHAETGMINGSGKTFLQMYLELGGTPLDELFGNQKTSDAVHVVQIVSPDNQTTSFINKFGLYELKTIPLASQKVAKLPFTITPPRFNLVQGNRYLLFGDGEEGVPFHGEALLVTDNSDPSDVKVVRMLSQNYNWRLRVRGSNLPPKQRYLQLLQTRLLPPEIYNLSWPNLVAEYNLDVDSSWGRAVNIYLILMGTIPKPDAQFHLSEIWGSEMLDQPFSDYVVTYDPYTHTENKYLGSMNRLEDYMQKMLMKYRDGQLTFPNLTLTKQVVKAIVNVEYPSAVTSLFDQWLFTLHTMLYRPTSAVNISSTSLSKLLNEMKTYEKTIEKAESKTSERK